MGISDEVMEQFQKDAKGKGELEKVKSARKCIEERITGASSGSNELDNAEARRIRLSLLKREVEAFDYRAIDDSRKANLSVLISLVAMLAGVLGQITDCEVVTLTFLLASLVCIIILLIKDLQLENKYGQFAKDKGYILTALEQLEEEQQKHK